MNRRVVITGTGLVSAVGKDVQTSWTSLLEGRSGVDTISSFDPSDLRALRGRGQRFRSGRIHRPEGSQADRPVRAARDRRRGSGDARGGTGRRPLISRSGHVRGDRRERHRRHRHVRGAARRFVEKGPSRVSPFFVPMFIADIAAGLISIRYGAKGPNYATVSACASGAHAIGNAYRSIQSGEADVMITGGTEASVTPMTLAGFAAMTALSERNDSPATASRPFDATRDGFVLGEGAGILVLESLEHAVARGATIIAESPASGRRPTRTTSPLPRPVARARCGRCVPPAKRRSRVDGRRLYQRPRYVDPGERCERDDGDQDALRRSRLRPDRGVDQVDDRPHPRRRRRSGGRDHRSRLPPWHHSADHQLLGARSRVRPGLRHGRERSGGRSTSPCRTASASAATTLPSRYDGGPGRSRASVVELRVTTCEGRDMRTK
jgi:hypothetical protein